MPEVRRLLVLPVRAALVTPGLVLTRVHYNYREQQVRVEHQSRKTTESEPIGNQCNGSPPRRWQVWSNRTGRKAQPVRPLIEQM